MEVVDDVKQITILVESAGDVIISNLQYPSQVDVNEPFDIIYDCVNNGIPDELWGVMTSFEKPISNTYWVDIIETVKQITTHFNGIQADLSLGIKVGRA